MNLLESLIYGIISGLTEFLPTSSYAHQTLLQQILGGDSIDPLQNFFVHVAVLFAVLSNCRLFLDYVVRFNKSNRRNYNVNPNNARFLAEFRFVRRASIVMLVGFFCFRYIFSACNNLLWTAAFLGLNGLILFMSERLIQGNKDVRSMSGLDSTLVGIIGSLSACAGLSRTSLICTAAKARGANQKSTLNWALLLSIPALIAWIMMDIFAIVNGSTVVYWSKIFIYVISAIVAYLGGQVSIMIIRFLTIRSNYFMFAYYSWGTALLSFILYLTVV